jgi:hypothetical protein
MTVRVGYTINNHYCVSKATQGATLHHTMKAYRQNVSKTPCIPTSRKAKIFARWTVTTGAHLKGSWMRSWDIFEMVSK